MARVRHVAGSHMSTQDIGVPDFIDGEPTGPHRYTVDVILHAHEPYPCILCGRKRNDPIHEEAR